MWQIERMVDDVDAENKNLRDIVDVKDAALREICALKGINYHDSVDALTAAHNIASYALSRKLR